MTKTSISITVVILSLFLGSLVVSIKWDELGKAYEIYKSTLNKEVTLMTTVVGTSSVDNPLAAGVINGAVS